MTKKIVKTFKRHAYEELKTKTEVKKAKRFIKEVEENGIDYCLYNEREDVGYLIRNKKVVAQLSKSSFYYLTKCSFKKSFKDCIVTMNLAKEEVKDAAATLQSEEGWFDIDIKFQGVEEATLKICEEDNNERYTTEPDDPIKCTCNGTQCGCEDWKPIDGPILKEEYDYEIVFNNIEDDYSVHIDHDIINDVIKNIIDATNRAVKNKTADMVISYDVPDTEILTIYRIVKKGNEFHLSKFIKHNEEN